MGHTRGHSLSSFIARRAAGLGFRGLRGGKEPLAHVSESSRVAPAFIIQYFDPLFVAFIPTSTFGHLQAGGNGQHYFTTARPLSSNSNLQAPGSTRPTGARPPHPHPSLIKVLILASSPTSINRQRDLPSSHPRTLSTRPHNPSEMPRITRRQKEAGHPGAKAKAKKGGAGGAGKKGGKQGFNVVPARAGKDAYLGKGEFEPSTRPRAVA